MEERKVDNEITSTKQKINEIDYKIDNEKEKIKKLDDIQESMTALNKSLNRCIELLSLSLKGPTSQNMFEDMQAQNKAIYQNVTSELDDEMDKTRSTINKLYEEKDNIIKEDKNKKE